CQALAFEQGEGDLERLLGSITVTAKLFALRYQAVQLGLLADVGVVQFALAGGERELLRPEFAQGLGFALGLAPLVELPMQTGQLFGQPLSARGRALQVFPRLARLAWPGFGSLGLRYQCREFALPLLQPCCQLDGLLQARTVTTPGCTERLQRCARLE